jgi:hypothetical protein
MNKFNHSVVMGLSLGLLLAAAPVGASTQTADVAVRITVLPFAEVRMDHPSVDVAIPAGGADYTVYVGGTVVCNCSTALFASITKPDGAPGDWQSYPVSATKGPGQGHDPYLLRIKVSNQGSAGWTGTLSVFGESGEVRTPGVGEVVLTVMPN